MQGGTARTGVWIIGSRGSVATTAITGAAAVTAGLATTTGLVTMRPPFTEAGLPALDDLVFGGHDLIETPLAVRAARLVDGGVLPDGLPEAVAAQLAAAESRDAARHHLPRGPLRAARRRRARRRRPRRLPRPPRPRPRRRRQPLLDRAAGRAAPRARRPRRAAGGAATRAAASSRRARSTRWPRSSRAARSSTSRRPPAPACPALEALAERHGVPLGGSDGKTGETLLKTALAPMFAARALRVRSWAGANLLGGGDGEALADPVRARSKLDSKARSARGDPRLPGRADRPHRQRHGPRRVEDGLGPHHLRGLPRRPDEAAVHLGGLRLRARRAARARPRAPRVARARARRRPASCRELGFFFKDPAGTHEHALDRQYAILAEWARAGGRTREGARARRRRGARPPSRRALRPRRRAARRRGVGPGPRRAAARRGSPPRRPASTSPGMALNDYADREVDAVERPHAADPVRPRHARLRARAGGRADRRGGRDRRRRRRPARAAVLVPLAAAVWAYDLRAQADAAPGRPAWPPAAGSTSSWARARTAPRGRSRRPPSSAPTSASPPPSPHARSRARRRGCRGSRARRPAWSRPRPRAVGGELVALGRAARGGRRAGRRVRRHRRRRACAGRRRTPRPSGCSGRRRRRCSA